MSQHILIDVGADGWFPLQNSYSSSVAWEDVDSYDEEWDFPCENLVGWG